MFNPALRLLLIFVLGCAPSAPPKAPAPAGLTCWHMTYREHGETVELYERAPAPSDPGALDHAHAAMRAYKLFGEGAAGRWSLRWVCHPKGPNAPAMTIQREVATWTR